MKAANYGGFCTRSRLLVSLPERRAYAQAKEYRDGHPRHGAAGGPLRDPVAARKRLHSEESEERLASSSQGAWKVAPWWPWSPAEGRCREDGEEEVCRCDPGFEGEERSAPSQASAWAWPSTWLEDQGGVDDDGT